MATVGHAGGYLAPPLPLSLVAGAAEFWMRLSPVTQAALKRAGLNTSSSLCYAFDGSVEDSEEFVVGAGGMAEDVQLLLHIREACWPTARAEVRRVACMPTPLAVAAAAVSVRKRSQAELGLPTHIDSSIPD